MKKYYDLQTLDINLQKFRRNGAFKRNAAELSDADLAVLFGIKFHLGQEKIKLSDIAYRLDLTLPAITHKVNDLEARNLVVKNVSKVDKRIVNIELTSKAEQLVESIVDGYYMPLKRLTDYLGEEDIKTLNKILEKANRLGKIK